jgi:hypothetical protein
MEDAMKFFFTVSKTTFWSQKEAKVKGEAYGFPADKEEEMKESKSQMLIEATISDHICERISHHDKT